MRLLAVDTATEICGVALTVDNRLRAQVVLDHGETHTRHIMMAIESALAQAQMHLKEIDAFAVTQGPGSFTGLRIGISTIKGFAIATGKPMVGVSTLEVLARQGKGETSFICPIIDARRNELYWTLFQRTPTDLQSCMPETVGPVYQIPPRVKASCQFIGNGVPLYQQQLQSEIDHPTAWASPHQCRIQPSMVARLAGEKIASGKYADVMSFGPVYLRKSDAEINRQKSEDGTA